ncbi:MAG: hypothetical protein KGK11_03750 [Sphingomonadales bacterium]|nr:hypothetical protein [Sphingomonadales bacterium]
MTGDRRHFLGLASALGAGLVAARLAAAPPAACYDPASLSLSQKSRRRAVGYADVSADPAKHCGLCNFFAASSEGCGTCALLGGPVAATGLCDSFAAKSAKPG